MGFLSTNTKAQNVDGIWQGISKLNCLDNSTERLKQLATEVLSEYISIFANKLSSPVSRSRRERQARKQQCHVIILANVSATSLAMNNAIM